MSKRKLNTVVLLALVLSGCAIETDRTGFASAWYYERLTPYYENDLFLEPRVHLRAVQELVGIPKTFGNGIPGHVDVLRQDIELFFAAPVPDVDDRLKLVKASIYETCPRTDVSRVQDKITYANPTYVVLQDVPCRGYAR